MSELIQTESWIDSEHFASFDQSMGKNVPGYVCNPGSPRERDAASKR